MTASHSAEPGSPSRDSDKLPARSPTLRARPRMKGGQHRALLPGNRHHTLPSRAPFSETLPGASAPRP